MPSINISLAHSLTEQDVKQRFQKYIDSVPKKFGGNYKKIESRWVSSTNKFIIDLGYTKITGLLEISNNSVAIKAKLPTIMFLLKTEIEKNAKKELKEILK